MLYVIGVLVVAVIVIAAVLFVRSRSAVPPSLPETGGDAEAVPARPADEPMTGLELALAQVTDRDGRTIGERIDAGASLVDELRVPDDTGPLLRRALDRVEHHEVEDDEVEHHERAEDADHG